MALPKRGFGRSGTLAVNAGFNSGISRGQFLKTAGLGAAAIAATGLSLGGMVHAQTPPAYPPDYTFPTLAALVDTVIPGPANTPIMILDQNFQPIMQNGQPLVMANLGSSQTATLGAAGYVSYPPYFAQFPNSVPGAYPFLYIMLPLMARNGQIISALVSTLDAFAKGITGDPDANFKDLSYDVRYVVIDQMDKSAASGLIRAVLSLTQSLWNSEYCNLVPGGSPQAPEYNRPWMIIPGGAWAQMGYPGPLQYPPAAGFSSPYFDARIKDGKLVFNLGD